MDSSFLMYSIMIAHCLCTAILKPQPLSYYSLPSTLCGFGSNRKIIKKDVKYKHIKFKIVNYTLQGFVKT